VRSLPLIGASYALPDTASALQRLIDGTAAGKIVVTVP
jgi:hypothetical protein